MTTTETAAMPTLIATAGETIAPPSAITVSENLTPTMITVGIGTLHDVVICDESDDDGGCDYYASCAPCQWDGPLRRRKDQADDDAAAHELGFEVDP